MIALRCPMFRGPSPAVVKLSNLLLLLNRSRGKSKIEQKFRWKELVVFKVNPVFAVAASVQQSTAKGASLNDTRDGLGASMDSFHSEVDSRSEKSISIAGERTPVTKRNPPPSPPAGMISVSPRANTKATKPSTVPYYDADSQAVVQIRRKKPMDELKTKFGDAI